MRKLIPTQDTLITSKGYPFERHRVVTDDGYILEMHRMPHGRVPCRDPCHRQPILLMSGLLGDSSNYVLDFPKQSIGFILADHKYDVWMGNVRGNTYGKKHRNLKSKSYELILFELFPRGAFYMNWAGKFCALPTRSMCSLVGDMVANLGSKYMNELVTTARPQKFDYGPEKNQLIYGQREPAEYNLMNVRTDVGIFWSLGDHVITPDNVRELIRDLGDRVKKDHFINDDYYTHAHFLMAMNNPDVLYGDFLSFLNRYATHT
ncbi:hypothetical protein HPB48_020900 [Haemaphysalis longicornis]|uniref:Partial AB-hydrolase lipase domain-containing protein n=1 Tax=Haemaphysalis longicornis TaxID=44386 RepID=A0A9J6H1M9_HAELO|nr:hypothetical protein HPB48_020900 [Haemaphysalis longicornis]